MVGAFSMSVNTNLAVYWGQNSYGATNPSDTANWQQPISYYCQDSTIDIIPMAFLDEFNSTGGLPSVNLANTCSTSSNGAFPGTQLPNCTFLAPDIQTCQNAGKIVTISLGGATGSASFADDSEGQAFAQTIWDLFLGGTSTTRPFGDAMLDGIDMDIEGGTQTGFTAFLTTLRQLMNGGSKPCSTFSIAPQCPYPDAYIGNTINVVPFDAVFVQFCVYHRLNEFATLLLTRCVDNNYCGLNNYNNPNVIPSISPRNRDNWAKTVSPNPNVKVFIGAPASSGSAGSGYVDASTIATIIQQTSSGYTSFGGVMLWDMSQAHANNRYDISVKNALTGGSGGGTVTTTASSPVTSTTPATTSVPATSTIPPTTTTTTMTTSTSASTGSCASVSPWQLDVAYVGGDQVTYKYGSSGIHPSPYTDKRIFSGHLWTAKWWTYNDVPGGAAGVWADEGACTTSFATAMIGSPGDAAQAAFEIFPAIATNSS
ncbi:glycoside hydrolase family 18 protein [Lanmaoa asiatica]|nr:glycoside hydrolase family 18 protein [Lanmaoa asiatica]